MLSPQTKNNIQRILPFGIIWFLFGLIYVIVEKGLLGPLTKYPSTGNPYNFGDSILILAFTATLSGLIVGTIEILYISKMFVQKSFLSKILIKTFIYMIIMISFLLVNTVISNSINLKVPITDDAVMENVWLFFSHFAFWGIEVYIAAIIGISLFYAEVSDNLGHGVLNNFFLGKYHKPTEERIFMFLDMKSSTTIAENMGHARYFDFLKEYYKNLNYPVIKYTGEIYQYVGDEIVVSWTMKNGLYKNNAIKCFFALKKAILDKSEMYIKKFGIVPEFKAGFHLGTVTTGEIGVIKKDIIFTGDVLNTTARIQGLCNSLNSEILISENLLTNLKDKAEFDIKPMGSSTLRGKEEKIELFSIRLLNKDNT